MTDLNIIEELFWIKVKILAREEYIINYCIYNMLIGKKSSFSGSVNLKFLLVILDIEAIATS